jgi:hypothetical protein
MSYKLKIKNYQLLVLISIIFSLALSNFALAQETSQMKPPETIEEAKGLGKKFLVKIKELLPGILEGIWQEGVLPIWRKMYQIWSNWWDSTIQPWLESIWYKIKGAILGEVEKRKPQIEEEFEEEKEELKTEAPEVGKTLWERFKELIK